MKTTIKQILGEAIAEAHRKAERIKSNNQKNVSSGLLARGLDQEIAYKEALNYAWGLEDALALIDKRSLVLDEVTKELGFEDF